MSNKRYSAGRGNTQMVTQEGASADVGGVIPFRRATTFRTSPLATSGPTAQTAAEQQVSVPVTGSGYMYGIDVEVDIETAGNAAVVAWHEDAPWNAVSSVVLGDVNGELVNVQGIHLRFQNLYGGSAIADDAASTDETVFEQVSGAVARGGSAHFHLMVPCGLDHRRLLGIVGNQDRSQSYNIRTNVNASGSVYTTPPTALGNVTIQRTYQNYAVPAAANAQQVRQEQTPPHFGVLHYITQTVAPSPPQSSSVQNHFLPRIGNTLRLIILVFRDGNGATARADAEANLPTLFQFILGDTPIFTEGPGARRKIMRDRYGFDAPNGVFVYDWITDIVARAGAEMGDDYLFTNGLTSAQFQVTYGAGWAADSSLTIVTDDLVIPAGLNIYN